MLLATSEPSWFVPAICVVGIGLMTALVFGLFWFSRSFVAWGRKALQKTYEGIQLHHQLCPGDVQLSFRTYFGFGGGGYQCEHRVYLSPEAAECLLNRLHAFNLHWGWFCPGGLFVPILSYINYRSALKLIRARRVEHGL